MTKAGNDLENFVQFIEGICLPLGFKIRKRKKVIDESGNHVAELDIVVNGKIGTTEFRLLFECRDRPSYGSAPVSWIEQLAGRRDRLKFDKVIAVSTTGFSPGAVDYALKKGIELRTVQDIQKEDIVDWFQAEKSTLYQPIGTLKKVYLYVDKSDEEQKKQINCLLADIDNKTKIFLHTTTNDKYSILDIWIEALNKNQDIFKNLELSAPPIEKSILLNYINPESRYKISLKGQDIHIVRILFIGDFSIDCFVMPISKITKYYNQDNKVSIAETVHFEINNDYLHKNLAIHKIINQEEIKFVASISDTVNEKSNEK
jgi:hypothetical protein